MRSFLVSLLLLSIVACQSTSRSGVPAIPGHGAISIEVAPNPIVATRVSGNMYDFPINVVVKETGGHPVNITRVSVVVYAPGGFPVARDSFDANKIRSTGASTTIDAHSEARYHFTQRKEVPDERLFNGVSAELRVDATSTGTATNATTRVTVTRGQMIEPR